MTSRPIHWHEGMFLRPHHFQAAQRYLAHAAHVAHRWDVHHNWGLRHLDLDREGLANHRFVVRELHARLRDGTLVAIPEDGDLAALDLKPALERSGSITVYLAVPALHVGRANVADARAGEGPRYLLDVQELEDENTGVNPQLIQVRLLNVRLLLSTDEHAGYEVLPVARVEKSPAAGAAGQGAAVQLDESYIPPVLACDAWMPLQNGILQAAFDRIGKKLDLLAEQAVARNITFDSSAQGERLLFEQIRVLNEAQAVLGVNAFAEGVHPLPAYRELCRLVGQLSIFDQARRVPPLPPYDHDDLGGCFYRVKQLLDALLDVFVEPAYKERAFVGAGLRMQVALEPMWLESTWQMFIGVESPLEAEECVRLLTRPGQLDLKIGSSDRVDAIFRAGQAGLRFTHSPQRPAALPQRPGLTYFQINPQASQAEWLNVQRSLTLALRLNENRIAGNIQGQRVLTINLGGGQTTTLQFTLFVVPVG
jgi:type VI secretion system protein ImpJ